MKKKRLSFLLGCLLGADANNGTNAGLAYVNSNNGVANSNTNVGSRICKTNKPTN